MLVTRCGPEQLQHAGNVVEQSAETADMTFYRPIACKVVCFASGGVLRADIWLQLGWRASSRIRQLNPDRAKALCDPLDGLDLFVCRRTSIICCGAMTSDCGYATDAQYSTL